VPELLLTCDSLIKNEPGSEFSYKLEDEDIIFRTKRPQAPLFHVESEEFRTPKRKIPDNNDGSYLPDDILVSIEFKYEYLLFTHIYTVYSYIHCLLIYTLFTHIYILFTHICTVYSHTQHIHCLLQSDDITHNLHLQLENEPEPLYSSTPSPKAECSNEPERKKAKIEKESMVPKAECSNEPERKKAKIEKESMAPAAGYEKSKKGVKVGSIQ